MNGFVALRLQVNTAWPIVGYTYLVIRKETLRQGATCKNVQGTYAFWKWFLTEPIVRAMAQRLGFGVLPPTLRDLVLERMHSDLKCEGNQV